MARETVSLDFTAPAPGELESDTPLCPGYQIIHVLDEDGKHAGYQVRRITLRVTARDAARGIAEEYHTYPALYPTFDQALEAAKAAFATDGPGDDGKSK